MKEKFIFKKLTDCYFKILEKHDNPKWSIDELSYLVYDVHKEEYLQLNDDEKWQVNHLMEVLRNHINK